MSRIKGEVQIPHEPDWLTSGVQFGAPREVMIAAYQAGLDAGAGVVTNRVLMALGLIPPEEKSSIVKP